MIVEPLKGKRIEIKTDDPYDDYVVFYSVKGKGFTEKDIKSAVEWALLAIKNKRRHTLNTQDLRSGKENVAIMDNLHFSESVIREAFEDVIEK